jgi:hypothetical protein
VRCSRDKQYKVVGCTVVVGYRGTNHRRVSNKFLLAKDDKKFCHVAEMMGNTKSLDKIWKWAKVNVTADKLKNEFFVIKDDRKALCGSWQQSGAKRNA